MIGINKIKEGWYSFKNAVGIGDEKENNEALKQIQADTEKRKQAIVDGAIKVAEQGSKAKEEFKKAYGSLSFKEEDTQTSKSSAENKSSISSSFSDNKPSPIISSLAKKTKKEKAGMSIGGSSSGGGGKQININIEMKIYFNIDKTIGNAQASANKVIAGINDRLKEAIASQ